MCRKPIDVPRVMHAQDLLQGCRHRRHVVKKAQQAACDQLIVDGFEALRAFGMPIAHFMQPARRMGNI
jgi:hypothetical protein